MHIYGLVHSTGYVYYVFQHASVLCYARHVLPRREMCMLKTYFGFSLELWLTNKAKRRTKATLTKAENTQARLRLKSKAVKMKLEASLEDMSEWREVDFALNCTYIVHDQASEPCFSLPKAMTSIPRNLTFQYSADNQVRSSVVWGYARCIPNSFISTDFLPREACATALSLQAVSCSRN